MEELNDPEKQTSLWGGSADPDRDGRINLLEYAQGSGPRAGVDQADTMTMTSGEKVQVTFRMRADDPELNFSVEVTDNLSALSWSTQGFEEIGERVPDLNDPAYEMITIEADPAVAPKLFMRVRVRVRVSR